MPAIPVIAAWVFGSLWATEKTGDAINTALSPAQPGQPSRLGIGTLLVLGAGSVAAWYLLRGRK